MISAHPQFITDTTGQKLVVLSQKEFDTIMDELDGLEDIRLYDEAKKEDDGKRELLNDYIKNRRAKDGK